MALGRLRAVPWLIVLQAGMIANEHWQKLSANERSRLADLIRVSKGSPKNLSAKERAEVKRLARKLDIPGVGKTLLPMAARGRGRRG
jgi:hypothetical protein